MQNETPGPGYLLLTSLSTTFAWITIQDAQIIMTLLSTALGIISALCAIRYYIKKSK